MAATKPKKATRSAAKQTASGKQVDAIAVREHLTSRVLSEASEILERVIEAAKTGNYLPAKFLFEFAGILEPLPKLDADAEAQSRVHSLTEILLDALQNAPKDNSQETPAA